MGKLQIFTTGGTIDKVYFDALSEFQIDAPVIDSILRCMNVGFEYTIDELMRLDSLDMTDDHRRQIQQAVAAARSQKVLITHGTDGMVRTASWLREVPNKTIVLTGALQPAAFTNTDAVFNIGSAIGAIQMLTEGVYIAMNGQIFSADNVLKNRTERRFEPVV
jgi:L-asparaginase